MHFFQEIEKCPDEKWLKIDTLIDRRNVQIFNNSVVESGDAPTKYYKKLCFGIYCSFINY